MHEQLPALVVLHDSAAIVDELLDPRCLERALDEQQQSGNLRPLLILLSGCLVGLDISHDVMDLLFQVDAGKIAHHLPALVRARFDRRHELATELGGHDVLDVGKRHDLGIGRNIADFQRQPGRYTDASVVGEIGNQPARKADQKRANRTEQEIAGSFGHAVTE
jgi:hypothetical protein